MQDKITIYPTERLPSLLAKSGRSPTDGVPFRWLESLVQSIRAAITDDAEEATCMMYGTEHLVAVFDHTLEPLEVAQRENEALRRRIASALAIVENDGLTAEAKGKALRDLLGL